MKKISSPPRGVSVEFLRGMPCAECGTANKDCVIVFNPRCHKEGGTFVKFHKADDTLEIVCATCNNHVVTIALPRPN